MDKKKIGKAIKAHREKAGITKYYVAKNTKLRYPQIDDIDKGESSYTIDSLLAYAECIDMPLFQIK